MISIGVEQLRELYSGVARRSLRMETRQAYAVPWEDESVAAWLRGEPLPPDPALERHRAKCRALAASGRHAMRVRFLELPTTEYTRYEFEHGYPGNFEAGEEIHILDRAAHPEFDHVREDFVVFDDTGVMFYRYAADDTLTGYEYTDDPTVVRRHLDLAEQVLAAATPYPQWVAERG